MTATRVHTTAHLHGSRVVYLPLRRRRWHSRPVMVLRGAIIGVLFGGCLWALGVAAGRAMFGQGTTVAGLIAAGLAAAGLAVCMATDRGVRR